MTNSAFSKNFSATYLARFGSPGSNTVLAKAPAGALIWGVGGVSFISPGKFMQVIMENRNNERKILDYKNIEKNF